MTLNSNYRKQSVQSSILKFTLYANLHIVNHQLHKLLCLRYWFCNVLRVVQVTGAASIHPIVLVLYDSQLSSQPVIIIKRE